LLAIQTLELRPALDQASTLVGEALRAEKVDIFLFEPTSNTLVAMGTSVTPLGKRQHELGLDRLPLANGGPVADVFLTGHPYANGHADEDPRQPQGIVKALGIRSQLDVPLELDGERRGVLAVASTEPERFSEQDLAFLEAVAGWIGMLTHRAELVAAREREAVSRGRREAGDELALLTPRQMEVAACVAEGLSNEEIAERLVLSQGTVANHLRSMLDRLGFNNRVQIAVWAVERGLYRSSQTESSES